MLFTIYVTYTLETDANDLDGTSVCGAVCKIF